MVLLLVLTEWDFARACVCDRVNGFEIPVLELAVVIVLAGGLVRPEEEEDTWDTGRRVVAAVRLVTVDLEREWLAVVPPRLEATGGGPPDDRGRPVLVVVVVAAEAEAAAERVVVAVEEDGAWRVEAALPRGLGAGLLVLSGRVVLL